MRTDFVNAIKTNQAAFGLSLHDAVIERLADFYALVLGHNPLLHLVGPSSPEEFAVRHILESLTLLEHLPDGAKFADIGTGAGLPAIPCLLARDDLGAVLIESKEKKAAFLATACSTLGIEDRVQIINRQFSETDAADCAFVTCRALDKFTEKLPQLTKWSRPRPMLLFGGENLRSALQENKIGFVQKLMPLSERRYLFVTT